MYKAINFLFTAKILESFPVVCASRETGTYCVYDTLLFTRYTGLLLPSSYFAHLEFHMHPNNSTDNETGLKKPSCAALIWTFIHICSWRNWLNSRQFVKALEFKIFRCHVWIYSPATSKLCNIQNYKNSVKSTLVNLEQHISLAGSRHSLHFQV